MRPISKALQAAALVALFACAASGQATTRTVTDTIRKPDGSVWVGAAVKFTLDKSTYTSTTSFPAATVTATTDAQGRICVSPCSSPGVALWANAEGAVKTLYTATYPDGSTFQFRLAYGDGSAIAVPVLRAGGIAPASPADPLYVSMQALVTAHAAAADPHPGYLTQPEGDARYALIGSGVTDHGALSGLGDDDHTQYLNNARGDARYYTQAQLDGFLAAKAALAHTHLRADITDFAHTHAVADTTGLQAALDAKQPLDADLTVIAGLSPSANDVMQFVSGSWAARTSAQLKASLSLAQADVAGLTTASSPTFAGLSLSGAVSSAGSVRQSITNTNAGGYADLVLFNDSGKYVSFQLGGGSLGGSYGSTGVSNNHSAKLVTSADNFILGTDVVGKPLIFANGGAEVGRFNASGIFSQSNGAAVASAATITPTGNSFHVTGTTTITSVSGTGIRAGTTVTIIFDGALTFTDGGNLKLAGDFVTTADDTITLRYDGSNWYEVGRSVN